jgi:hypothetical protein
VFARVNFFEGDVEAADRATRGIVLPRIREAEGFKGYIVLLSPGGGQAIGLTFWESEEAEAASDEIAKRVRPLLQEATGGRVIRVERYRVGAWELA